MEGIVFRKGRTNDQLLWESPGSVLGSKLIIRKSKKKLELQNLHPDFESSKV